MGVSSKWLLAGGLLASIACSATLVGTDSTDAADGGTDSGVVVPADGSVVPGDDGGGSSSGGVTGCATLAVFPSSTYDFGAVRIGTTVYGRLVLRNLGTETLAVKALGLGLPFSISSPATFSVRPTASANLDLGFSPTNDTPAGAKVTLEWPGCSAEVTLSGVGSTSEIIVNPATLNLGSARCGAGVASGQVTINSTVSTTYTAQIALPFTTSGPLAVTSNVPAAHAVGAGTFGPNDPPTSYEGLLQLAFATGGTKTVKVLAESVGGVVNVNNVTLDPSGIAIFRNTGNEGVAVKLVEAGLSFSPSTFELAPGATRNVTVSRVNQSQSSFQVTVNLTAGKNCGGTAIFLVSTK